MTACLARNFLALCVWEFSWTTAGVYQGTSLAWLFFQKGTALLHSAANDGIAETHINLLIRELEKQTEQNSLITIVKM